MLNKIVDPNNGKSYSINSKKAKELLKNYIKILNGGGNEQLNEKIENCRGDDDHLDRDCVIDKIKKFAQNPTQVEEEPIDEVVNEPKEEVAEPEVAESKKDKVESEEDTVSQEDAESQEQDAVSEEQVEAESQEQDAKSEEQVEVESQEQDAKSKEDAESEGILGGDDTDSNLSEETNLAFENFWGGENYFDILKQINSQ